MTPTKDQLRELEPSAGDLDGGMFDSGMSSEMRVKIQHAARMRVLGESWDTIADVLGYESGDSASRWLKEKHPECWDMQGRAAYEAVMRSRLPKLAVRVQNKAMQQYLSESYDEDKVDYEKIARLALQASNGVTKMLKRAADQFDSGSGDRPSDRAIEEAREAIDDMIGVDDGK